nr:hypothetical protein BaRGS_024570 [Batillaria attramentaria]
MVDCQLPSKKTFGTKTQEFTESRKEIFEKYLQVCVNMVLLTDEQKKQRFEEALNGFIDYIPSYVASVVGSRKTVEGCKFLVDIFQKPKLNKQLTYVMLDIMIMELFPELSEEPSSPKTPRP